MTHRARILLVDDREQNLLALEAVLASLDQVLVKASSGEEALRALLKDEYALILLDAQMPVMDGFETASRIKARTRTKDVPIIFLTAADTGQQHAYRGYAAGGADYISKPFDPWVLRAKVSVFVELYMKNCQLREQAALLRLQLEGGGKAAVGEVKEPAGLLAELSARLAAVEEQAEALSKQLPTEYDPPARLGWLYLKAGKLPEAATWTDKALTLVYGPRKGRLLTQRAEIAKAAGDKATEKKFREQAVKLWESLPAGQQSPESLDKAKQALAAVDAPPAGSAAPAH